MTVDELREEVAKGGRLVVYQWCISAVLVTILQPSSVRFIPAGESSVVPGLKYSLITMLAGWWGFPWGPIRSIQALGTNFSGGRNVTNDVMNALRVPPPPVAPPPPGAAPAQPAPAPSQEPTVAESVPAIPPGALAITVHNQRSNAVWERTVLVEDQDLPGWNEHAYGWSIGPTGSPTHIQIDEPGLTGSALGLFREGSHVLLYGQLDPEVDWPAFSHQTDRGSTQIVPESNGGLSERIDGGPLHIGAFRIQVVDPPLP